MRQAIITKYLGPTNYRGARIKATAYAGSVTLSWDAALDVDANHDAAARALAVKCGWLTETGKLVGGSLPTNDGNCYVIVHRATYTEEQLAISDKLFGVQS